MRPAFVLPAAVFAALAAVLAVYLHQLDSGAREPGRVPSALIGRPAPPLDLPPIDGQAGGLSSGMLVGEPSLVNVFASWCPPCRVEHPVLMRLARDGVPIYGVNYKDAPEDARAFLAELGDPYRAVGADRSGRTAIDWGVYGYPETFVVDQGGRIRHRHVGPLTAHDLEARIRPLLDRLAR